MEIAEKKSFDRTVRRLCNKKITDPDAQILGEKFTVEQAIAAAVIKKAMGGAADAVKLIREILGSADTALTEPTEFRVDINVVE